jgi:chromosome segregation ATPase
MNETMTETMTDNIASLKAAVREASNHERELALEVDNLPNKIQEAAHQDAANRARAAREGGAVAAVESEIPALREREQALPFLRWDAGIRHAALEVELYATQQADQERKRDHAAFGIEELRLDADEANRKYNEKASAVQAAEGAASRLSYARSVAEKRLFSLEQEYPNA